MKKLTIIVSLFLLATTAAFSLTAEEIIKRMDNNQKFTQVTSSGSLITHDRFGEKKSDYTSWVKGDHRFLIEFTSVEEEGQKILRTENELYLYYPDAEDIIRLQGAALRQSMLGSDISYEDMTEGNDTLDKYDVELEGRETIEDKNSYVIMMRAISRSVPYPAQKLWIDPLTFLPIKGEYYSKSGKILKSMRVQEVKKIGDRFFITKMVLEDKLKRNSYTEMITEKVDTKTPIRDDFFSLDELSW